VAISCDEIQVLLAEYRGHPAELSDDEARHVERCAACRAVAKDEARLSTLLAEARPAEVPEMVPQVMAAVASLRRRQRLIALLPVGLSAAITATGVALVGGVPGGSLVTLVPAWSRHGWMALAAMADSWVVAAGAILRTVPDAVPVMVPIVAGLLGVATLAGAIGLTARWRSVTPWRRDH
jgi:predicted anti-sigma-YlaC factor YlaD